MGAFSVGGGAGTQDAKKVQQGGRRVFFSLFLLRVIIRAPFDKGTEMEGPKVNFFLLFLEGPKVNFFFLFLLRVFFRAPFEGMKMGPKVNFFSLPEC